MPNLNESVPSVKPLPAFGEATRESTRSPTADDRQFITGLSGFFGLVMGLAMLAGCALLRRLFHWFPDVWIPLMLAVFTGLASASILFLWLAVSSWRGLKLIKVKETIKSAPPALPAPAPVSVIKYDLQLTPARSVHGEMEMEDRQLIQWCQAVIAGQSISINKFSGVFAGPNGQNGRERYEAFLADMKARELVENYGGNKGWKATKYGVQFAQGILNDHNPALLEAGEYENAG